MPRVNWTGGIIIYSYLSVAYLFTHVIRVPKSRLLAVDGNTTFHRSPDIAELEILGIIPLESERVVNVPNEPSNYKSWLYDGLSLISRGGVFAAVFSLYLSRLCGSRTLNFRRD